MEMKDTNLTENKTSRTAGNSPIKNNKNDSALKGISQDLLNKVAVPVLEYLMQCLEENNFNGFVLSF